MAIVRRIPVPALGAGSYELIAEAFGLSATPLASG